MWTKNKSKFFLLGVLAPRFTAFILVFLASAATSRDTLAKDSLTTPGLAREFSVPIDEVRQAVVAVVRDQIIHGTLIFDKSPILTGAEAVSSTPLFDPWPGPGEA